MKSALLDVNALIALLWPAHQHHRAAQAWFGARGSAVWATCPLVELGFVRIVSNPAFSRDAITPPQAVDLLGRNLTHPHHTFWADSLGAPEALAALGDALRGHRQATDGYLLALAKRNRGVLASFDRGLADLAGGGRLVDIIKLG